LYFFSCATGGRPLSYHWLPLSAFLPLSCFNARGMFDQPDLHRRHRFRNPDWRAVVMVEGVFVTLGYLCYLRSGWKTNKVAKLGIIRRTSVDYGESDLLFEISYSIAGTPDTIFSLKKLKGNCFHHLHIHWGFALLELCSLHLLFVPASFAAALILQDVVEKHNPLFPAWSNITGSLLTGSCRKQKFHLALPARYCSPCFFSAKCPGNGMFIPAS